MDGSQRSVAGWRRFEETDESVGGALFVPDRGEALQLVVALHGCRQTAGDFAIGTGFADLAAQEGFAVLFPESVRTEAASRLNPLGCWVWWAAANQTRGGEPGLIAGLMDRARAAEPRIAPARACITGLSSGAAMATILAAVYPDKIRAVASHAGVAFSAAEVDQPSLPTWFEKVADPQAALAAYSPLNWYRLCRWARDAPAAMGRPDARAEARARRIVGLREQLAETDIRVRALVVHGDADATVDPSHARQLIVQILQVAGLTETEDEGCIDTLAQIRDETRAGDGAYPMRMQEYRNDEGRLIARLVRIGRLGHAWSGGSPAGTYTDAHGPDATALTWAFFRDCPAE